nr:ATP-binding protein [Motiliproteus sediminis]
MTSAAAYFSYRDATHEVEELFDAELAQMARVLQSLLQDQLKRSRMSHLAEALEYEPFELDHYEEGNEATTFGHRYEKKLAFMVWNGDGEELLSSFHVIARQFSFDSRQGYGEEVIDNHHWRSFALHDPQHDLWIKVGQRDDVRDELTGEIVLHTLLPLLLTIPLLAAMIWLIVNRGLSPLRRVARQIIERNPEQLQPLPQTGVPEEIGGVVSSVNTLMASLDNALTRERRFTADAAHELRTPLAGIRIHAQNLRQEHNPATVATADQIVCGVDRMTRVVEQLLTLSRLEHDKIETSRVNLSDLVRTTLADQASHMADKTLDLSLETADSLYVWGHEASLSILCRNLIDNAMRYTPDGGQVMIGLDQSDGEVVLRVCDTGPGIVPEQRDAALQRFYRLAGQSISGSGLGLSIVREVTEQHRGSLLLSDTSLGPNGLCVTVRLPTAAG